MNPESRFKTKVAAELRKLSKCWFVKFQALSLTGVPDLLICYRGRFAAWELKVGAGKPTKRQSWALECIRRAGGIARVVRPETLEEALVELKKSVKI